jgi:hypothetical protein
MSSPLFSYGCSSVLWLSVALELELFRRILLAGFPLVLEVEVPNLMSKETCSYLVLIYQISVHTERCQNTLGDKPGSSLAQEKL